MSEAITPDLLRNVAKLSRLSIPEARLQTLAPQLGAILGYIDQLSKVDVEGVEVMAHATGLTNVLREDVVGPMLPLDQVLRNAPDKDEPYFKVPKVLGGDEDSAG